MIVSARPRRWRRVIAFLLGDRASFMTGEQMKVDGGLLAGIAVVLPA